MTASGGFTVNGNEVGGTYVIDQGAWSPSVNGNTTTLGAGTNYGTVVSITNNNAYANFVTGWTQGNRIKIPDVFRSF